MRLLFLNIIIFTSHKKPDWVLNINCRVFLKVFYFSTSQNEMFVFVY